ncbi:hypothetical protein K3495_g14561, partial [Podosphaera aphanis]
MADIPSHIECLKGQSSYRVWSVQIKSVLQSRGLWPYVLGLYKEPNELEEGESKKDFNIHLRDFYIEKAKAAGILQQSLSKDIILDVEFIEDPCDIWTFLKSKYEPSGLAHQFAQYQEWQCVQYDGRNLEEFIHKYSQACSRLKESKVDVSDTIKLYQFITIISPWFENFTANIRDKLRTFNSEKDLPLLNDVISNLLDEDKAQKYNQTVNFARKEKLSQNQRLDENIYEAPSTDNEPSCSHCGLRHNQKKCWHLHPEKAPKGFKPKKCDIDGCKLTQRYKEHEFKNTETKSPNRNFLVDIPNEENFITQLNPASKLELTISEGTLQALRVSELTDTWILDSGATSHFTHDLEKMFDYQACDVGVEFGKGSAKALAHGSVKLDLIGDKTRSVTFSDVFYVPELRANLLSTEKLRSKGLFYRNDRQILYTESAVISNVYVHQKVPHIRVFNPQISGPALQAMKSSHVLSDSTATADIWHARFGHLTETKLEQVLKVTKGVKISGTHKLGCCHSCKEATSKRIISRIKSPRPKQPLTHWNVDVVTVSPDSIGRAKYFTLMTDATTLTHRVGFHASKDGAYVHLQNLINFVKTSTNTAIKVIHVDGGREYGGRKLTELCNDNGIDLHVTTPHNSEQNGRAEVSNHLVCTLARKMMIHGKVPKGLWAEAIDAAVYIINITPSITLGGISPHQALA